MTWKRPNRCEASGCLEVARFGGHLHLRSSRRPDAVAIVDPDEREAFLAAVRAGEFDWDGIREEAL